MSWITHTPLFLVGSSLVFVAALLLLAWVDIKAGLLPDILTIPLAWIGLLVNLNGMIVPLQTAVVGAAGGYLTLWTFNRLYKLVSGTDGMGYGDFKMTAALGAWLGAALLPWLLLGAALFGLGMYCAERTTDAGNKHFAVPFGPGLAFSGIAGIIMAVYSRLA